MYSGCSVILFLKVGELITFEWTLHFFPQKYFTTRGIFKKTHVKIYIGSFLNFILVHKATTARPRVKHFQKPAGRQLFLSKTLPVSSLSDSKLQSVWVTWAKTANKTTREYFWIWNVGIFTGFVTLSLCVMACVGTELISQQDWVSCQQGSFMRWSRRPLRWDLANLRPPWTARHLSACSGEQQRKTYTSKSIHGVG